MTEFELIYKIIPELFQTPQTIVGAGDDCSVLDVGNPTEYLIFKTDAIVLNVHFTEKSSWKKVGRKAISRCLSDMAAMAGMPISALVTLGMPKEFDPKAVAEIYEGLNEQASKFGVSISGGETVHTIKDFFLSISMVGKIPKHRLLLRRNAQVGDALFVTGTLGGSIKGKHLDFTPRVKEAQWLADCFDIHAMIDLSDGIAEDIRHIMKQSHVGMLLLKEAIPVSVEAKICSREDDRKKPLEHALCDGEDFELLFTLPPKQAVTLLDAWKKQFPKISISCIGKVTEGNELFLRDRWTISQSPNSKDSELNLHGYDHFK